MIDDDMDSAYHHVLRRAFQIAAETGERCRPLHLLAALAEGDGTIQDALRPTSGDQLFSHAVDPLPVREGGASYLAMQTQQAARQLASARDESTTPEHLFVAILDQAEPEAVALLTHAGLDMDTLRTGALDILGPPPDLPPMAMPALVPAGTMDHPPLPVSKLDPTAWAVLCWRQDHLPIRRLRRRSHYSALCHLESRACLRVASRFGLDDDQRYSLSRHHLSRVEELVAQSRPNLSGLRSASEPFSVEVTASRRPRFGFAVGWGTWFSNRHVGLRDRWFRLRTIANYRGIRQA